MGSRDTLGGRRYAGPDRTLTRSAVYCDVMTSKDQPGRALIPLVKYRLIVIHGDVWTDEIRES